MPYVNVQDQRIFYNEHRDDLSGQRSPLVLVHGAGGVSYNWPPILRRLVDHDVYAIDLPGHGRSQGPGCEDIGAYTDFLRAWLEAMALPSIILAGHSMGGAIAMQFALNYPQRLKGLALIATNARLKVRPEIMLDLRSERVEVGQKLVEWVHGHRATPNQRRQYLRQFLAVDVDVMYGDWIACNGFDIRERLCDIHTPTLVIGGSQDQMTPLTSVEEMAKQIPDADLVVIDGAGHMVILEQPVLVTSAIAGFMDRVRRG